MKKQFRILLTALFFLGIFASCEQSDVNELNIEDPTTDSSVDNNTGGSSGGGVGGDPKGGD